MDKFYDPLEHYEKGQEGWDLLRAMVGFDKGPDEDEYIAWEEQALDFLRRHGKL